jgi:DNA-binding NarL/FixJ family response regulator
VARSVSPLAATAPARENSARAVLRSTPWATMLAEASAAGYRLGLQEQLLVRIKPPPLMRAPVATYGLDSLTEREAQLLPLVAAGVPYRDIAEHFAISERTVRTHIDAMLTKCGVANRTQLGLLALFAGRVDAGYLLDVWRTHAPHLLEGNGE